MKIICPVTCRTCENTGCANGKCVMTASPSPGIEQPYRLSNGETTTEYSTSSPGISAEEMWDNNSRSIPESFEGKLGDVLDDYPEIGFIFGESVMLKEDFIAALQSYASSVQTAGIKEDTKLKYRPITENDAFASNIDVIGHCGNCGVEYHIHKANEDNEVTMQMLFDYGFTMPDFEATVFRKGDLQIHFDSVIWWNIDDDGEDGGSKYRELKTESQLINILKLLE